MASEYVCARCGAAVGFWYGTTWKHQTGWRSKPTCGQKPEPVKRSEYKPR